MSSSRPFTTGQAAEYCSVSQATIVNWIKEGKLDGYTTPGGHYRIPRSNLVSFLRSYDMPIDTELKESTRRNLLVLSRDPKVRDVVKEVTERTSVGLSLTTSDYAASAAAARSKPVAVVIDVRTSSDPLGLCEWLSNSSENVPLLLVGDDNGSSVRRAGVDIYTGPDALANLRSRLEDLVR